MVPMPAVVFTLCLAVETKPLPFGSIFFVALLVTFVVLGRAACASRPASRLKLRHGKHLRYPGQRPVSGPPRNTTVPGLASWDFSTLRGFFSLLLFPDTAPVARFLPSTLVPSSVSAEPTRSAVALRRRIGRHVGGTWLRRARRGGSAASTSRCIQK